MQQQTNFFTPTQKHLIQLHGFPNITDIIYVKPLYSVRSLVVYPSLRPDSVAIPLFHSAEGQRYLSPQYYLLFATYHMYDRLFIYVKHTNSYVPFHRKYPHIPYNPHRFFLQRPVFYIILSNHGLFLFLYFF